jgi:peptidoglycan/xylan/chitin deacetylase (PgdA/CDA1 family)
MLNETKQMGLKMIQRAILLLLLIIPGGHALADGFAWPDGQKAAVSLSYDDTLDSQLDNALPALNKYKLKASFYLKLASPVLDARLDEWRAVAKKGHELGNHTIFHPCSASQPGTDWVLPYQNLDKYMVAQMREEILTANAFLKAIDGRTERTLTPPCLHLITSDGNYLPAVRELFVAIKTVEDNIPPGSEFWLPSGVSGEELIAFVDKVATKGGLANIIFHGVGGDYLSVSKEAHEQFLHYLAKNRDIYWTDTYLNIMKHVNATSAAKSE